MMEPGYIAFREDYRIRWSEPDAEPITAWNSTHHGGWNRIAEAVLNVERARCVQMVRDTMIEHGTVLNLSTSVLLQERILLKE